MSKPEKRGSILRQIFRLRFPAKPLTRAEIWANVVLSEMTYRLFDPGEI
jgi:hypothetical protein